MKTFIFALALISTSAFAEQREKVISNNNHQIIVSVNSTSVRCSAQGYGVAELKVDVPDLDWLASFNHRSGGEGQPCMTAGACRGGFGDGQHDPQDILADGDANLETTLNVKHVEVASIVEKTCARWLEERVEMKLRGKTFKHVRTSSLASLSVEKCRALYPKVVRN